MYEVVIMLGEYADGDNELHCSPAMLGKHRSLRSARAALASVRRALAPQAAARGRPFVVRIIREHADHVVVYDRY